MSLQIKSAFATKEEKESGHWISDKSFLSYPFCRDPQEVSWQNAHMLFLWIDTFFSKLVTKGQSRDEWRKLAVRNSHSKRDVSSLVKSINYLGNYLIVRIRRLLCSLKSFNGSKKWNRNDKCSVAIASITGLSLFQCNWGPIWTLDWNPKWFFSFFLPDIYSKKLNSLPSKLWGTIHSGCWKMIQKQTLFMPREIVNHSFFAPKWHMCKSKVLTPQKGNNPQVLQRKELPTCLYSAINVSFKVK